jgi:hypothetical protein
MIKITIKTSNNWIEQTLELFRDIFDEAGFPDSDLTAIDRDFL